MFDKNYSVICKYCKKEYTTPSDFREQTARWRLADNGNLYFNCSCNNTLSQTKGKYQWYNPTINMTSATQIIYDHLLSLNKKIPKVPHVLPEFEILLEKETSTGKELAQCAIQDPFFSGKIIGIANLRNRNSSTEIKSLEHAINTLGRETLRSLIPIVFLECLKPQTKKYTSNVMWTDLLLTANACVKINSLFVSKNFAMLDDEAFLVGALCNTGKIVASVFFPEQTDIIYEHWLQSEGRTPWYQVEQSQGAFSHTILGEIAGSLWGFPQFVNLHIKHHHDDTHEAFEMTDFIRNNILKLAICYSKLVCGVNDKKYNKAIEELSEALGLEKKVQQDIWQYMKKVYGEVYEKIKIMEKY